MPVKPCQKEGSPGFKWGDAGFCYTYTSGDASSRTRARNLALRQGRAIQSRRNKSGAMYRIADSETFQISDFEMNIDSTISPNTYRKGDVVIVPDYVYVDKSFGSSHEIDVVIRDDANNPLHWHDNIFLFITKMLDPEKEGKQIHLTFNPQQGPDEKFTSVMDLVLPIEMEEIQKALSPMPRWRTYIGESPKFNLSADTDRPYGFYSVGKSLETHQVQVDFDKTPWGFEDDFAGTVRVNGILETLDNPVGAMLEIYRMLKPGGRAIITVPSTRGTGTFTNPAYKSFWNESSFEFWTHEKLAKTVDGQTAIPSVFDLVYFEERIEGDSVYIDVVLEKPHMWKARHSVKRCMSCKSAPTVEVRWAEGMAHAWFCKTHLAAFKRSNPGEVNVERTLRYKVASPGKWSEGPPTREQAEQILGQKIEKFSIEPITRFVSPSPIQGDDANDWVQEQLAKGISITAEPLMNGLSAIVQSDGKRVSIRFNDGNERYTSLSKADEGIESLGNLPSFIVDADIGVIQNGERWSTERLDILKNDRPQLPDNARIVITASDLIYWDGKSLVDESFTKRKNVLSNRRDMLNSGGLRITKFWTIKSEGDLKRALTFETFGKDAGVMLRGGDWLYEPASSIIPTLPAAGMYKVLSTGSFGGTGQAPQTVEHGKTRQDELPPFLRINKEGLSVQADNPKNELGLTAEETLERLQEMQRPFTTEEIDFGESEEAFESGDICGACRFYLRDADSEKGRCQLLSPDVEVPWWFSSKAFIDARQEGLASLEEVSTSQHDGAMLAFYVAPDIAQRLAVLDGEEPEGMHITLAYFGKASDLDEEQVNAIRRIAQRMAGEYVPMKAHISGIGRFKSEEEREPVYASIDSEELHAFRMLLAALLESERLPINTEHGFTPHITIKYVAKEEQLPTMVMPDDELLLDNLSLTLAGKREMFPMQNTPKQVVVPVDAIFDALHIDTSKAREGEVQTLILDKRNFETKEDAREWVKDHDFKFGKIDETDNTWRFRQFDPAECDSGFRTFSITTGVQGVVCRGSKKTKANDDFGDEEMVYRAEIIKAADEDEKRFTFSVVYKPDEVDAHGEFASADELQEALWGYVKTGDRRIFLQHGFLPGIKFKQAGEWVEIVAWPEAVKATLRLPTGESFKRDIPANTIWMGVIWEPWAWQFVKEGKIRGFSFGGRAQRITRKFEAYGS